MYIDLNCEADVEIVRGYLSVAREAGKRVGLTSGCFDLLHFQHHYYLVRCRHHCDVLLVGVDSDAAVRQAKGPSRPIIPDYQRAMMVDGLKSVSVSFVMSSVVDFGRAAELFRPDFIFKNDDYRQEEVVGREFASGGVVTISDVIALDSTSDIIRAVVERSQADGDDDRQA